MPRKAICAPKTGADRHRQQCPVALLTGEFDYSCRPEDTRATAAAIPGATATIMPGLGHFPMSENYPALKPHLLPVLEAMAARG